MSVGKRGWCDFPGIGGNRKLALESRVLHLLHPMRCFVQAPSPLPQPPWPLHLSSHSALVTEVFQGWLFFCVETSQVSVLMCRATFPWVGQKGPSSFAHNFFHKLRGSGTLNL